MCGINAIFAYGGAAPAVDRDEVIATRESMHSRGPDAGDAWFSDDGRVGLGHRRLAIIDLSPGGAQPKHFGPLTIVFNGEIYNYRELRAQLEARGRRFTSQSDTEVLLQLYDEKQEAMLGELRGMFTIALWDGAQRRMLLARDPYGIKPLYYADDGATIRTASQVRALVAGGKVSTQFDSAGAAGFFLRGTVPEPFTMYRAIRALPAGSFLYVDSNGVGEPVPYFSIAAILRDAVERDEHFTEDQRREIVHDAVLESVRYHMVADVPVGAFLSAGIDSTAVVALAREIGATDLQTMTLRFEEYRGRVNDEAPLAALVARQYGVRHSIQELTLADFRSELPRIFDAMDQPTVDGLNSYFISKAAHGLGLKVAMSGSGGDELFGGYTSFRDIPRWMPVTSVLSRVPKLGDAVHRLNTSLSKRSRHISPKMGEIVRYGGSYAGAYLVKRGRFLASELPAILGDDIAAEGLARLDLLHLIERAVTPDPGNPFARVAALESSLYLRNQLLRDMDWASMAHSLEVRVPLVDAHLLRKVAPALVTRRERGKQLLAAAPRPPLPAEVRVRRKTGFTLPINEWLAQEATGPVEFGKRSWARKVYEVMFSAERGHW
ncbi:MAG TPA: asparagine synthase (glutamine-hydrolyzing) [Thermoanaerobaculia bacterium]|jgi:asparagine synthase (glutamine-hydrolysing)|nr:asparagine synthase (glutamine-hydrolyzing) [Thermoanaerobaculia bacterium]